VRDSHKNWPDDYPQYFPFADLRRHGNRPFRQEGLDAKFVALPARALATVGLGGERPILFHYPILAPRLP